MPHAPDDHHAERARARIGSVLDDKWTLDSLLGVGGMASVYAATHRNGKRGAIKVLHAEAALNPSVRTRFLREGYVANRVSHPGAVSIVDDDVAPDGTVYLVMELLEGETVDARCLRAGRKLAENEVLTIADQVLDVLNAAHAQQIVHRDLKPGNLFVTRDGTVKVLDFGIARLGEQSAAMATASATTSYHSSMGTLGFMPPEQARGRWEQVDARTDVWALGATMFALLTGRHVHEAQTANERLLLAMTKPPPPIATENADVTPAVAAIVDKALQFESKDRWPSAQAMQAAVREAYVTVTGKTLSLAPRLVVREPSSNDMMDSSADRAVGNAPTVLATSGSIGATTEKTRRGRGRAPLLLGAVAVLGVAGAVVFLRDKEPHGAVPAGASASAAPAPTAEPLPAMSEVLPATSAALPATSAALPATSAALPATSASFPATSAPLPATSGVLPAMSETLPATSAAFPPSPARKSSKTAPSASASAAPAPAPSVDLFDRRR